MAGVALADTVARLVREQWRLNLMLGFGARTGFDADAHGRLAKAAGADVPTVVAWLSGEVMPSTGQASAIMDALPLPAVGAVLADANGART